MISQRLVCLRFICTKPADLGINRRSLGERVLCGFVPSQGASVVGRDDRALALRMLKQADSNDVQVDIQLDIFDKVSKWVSISNKLEDQGESRIDDFKRRITGEGEVDKPKHYPPSRRPKGWKPPSDPPGPRLAALKSRLPGANAGGTGGDSGSGSQSDSDAA